MARGQRESESGGSSDSSSGSSSSNSSSSSDDSSGKSSRESSPDQKQRKKTSKSNKPRQSRDGDKKSRGSRQLKEKSTTKQRGGAKSSPRHKRVPRSPSPPRSGEAPSPRKHERGKPRSPPGSPPSESGGLPEDTHMEKVGGGRSADELSIGAGASDDEYRDELAQEDTENVGQEVPKKSKSRREGLSSGEVTPEDGDSDDSYSWRESRVRTMLQSHVQKPSNDGPPRESYDRYDSDHEGAQPFRSVVGTTITRPGQRYSDSDDGEIIDSDEEQEKRKSSRDKYSHGSPKRHSNQEDRRHRTKDSSASHRNGDKDSIDKNRRKTDRESSRDTKRSRRRSKEGSTEKTEDKKERKEKRKEQKDDEHYEDAKVKFRKRVWDKKEEESKGKRKAPDSPRPEEDDKPKEVDNKENEVPPPPKKKKEETLMTRTGGAYIPPAKLRMMQAQITDKSSEAYQRMSWEALKKSINGLINKVNVPNIPLIVQELLQLNIVRGRGLLARSIIAAQTASPTFTHVYGALVAIINTKFPQNGELLLRRLIINFKKGFKRNDKTLCLSSTRFIAHLVNQQVAHEIVALEILTLLLENVTDDSVEVAVGFVKECGLKLQEVSPRGIHAIFERMRSILHEAMIDKRVQYMVEVVFANRKDGFKDYPSVLPELDLVEESDQFTHMMTLEDTYQDEALLNVFKMDPEFLENEEKYKSIKKEILDEGSDDSDSEGGESGEASSSDDSDEEKEAEKMEILDKTETNLVALRRTIYLTIQSSLDFEECAHKMLKMDFKPGQEREVCNMILDCCAQQRTYEKFFGLLAQRFCQLKREYVTQCEAIFPEQYSTCHRLDTNKLRNVAKLFSHLLHTDAISWTVFDCVRMNEEDTTSSSRIFIKILFLELSEFMGLPKLNDRLKDKTLLPYFEGLLPRDNPANTRFAINFFTTIGLGGLTDDLRDHLKNVQRQIMQQRQPVMPSDSSSSSESESSSSSGSSESSSDSSSESSDSDRDRKKKKKKKVKETASKKSAPSKKDAGRGKEESRGKENGRGRNKERARQEERPLQEERVDRRNRLEPKNDMGGKGKKRGDSREMEDSRTQRNNRERDRTEMRGRPNDSRSNYANHDDERDPRHARNEVREPRRSRNEDMDSRYARNDERDPKHVRNEERDPKHVRNDERDPRHVRNDERDPRQVRNDERDPRQVRNDERDPRHVRNDERDPRQVRNEERDPRQVKNEDRDPRHARNEDRTREKPRGDERSNRNGERQQNAKERQQNARELKQQNTKRSKQEEEEESDSSESESSSSEESSSSSSESESSMDASPPRETQDKRGRSNPNLEEGRGLGRENISDKENQRGNRQRTRTDSSSDGYQKNNEPPNRDFNRRNPQPNNEYNDHRQARGDGWDGRRNRDNQYDRGGGNVRNPRTRYNSRGEEDYVNNARNKDYRGQDRMDTDGFDRRNDRGRGGYENDKPPPRHNERDRYDGDRGTRYNRY